MDNDDDDDDDDFCVFVLTHQTTGHSINSEPSHRTNE